MAAWPDAERQRGDAAFHRRHALLQHIVGRVHDARVDVAGHSQVEEVGAVLGVVEFVGDGLVYRHGHRMRGWLAFITGVDGLSFPASSWRFSLQIVEHGMELAARTVSQFEVR